MARFGDLDLSAVDRVEFMRVLVIYQNDPSHTDPALQWVMFGSPGGTVVKLDETECNRILNGKNPDMFGFAANLSASQLSCRARTHFLRLLDLLNETIPHSKAKALLKQARDGAGEESPRASCVSFAAEAFLAMNLSQKQGDGDLRSLIRCCEGGSVFFPDAVYRLRRICFRRGSPLEAASLRPSLDDLVLMGHRGGCGVRYFSRVVKYYRRPAEKDAVAFFPGRRQNSGTLEFSWVVGKTDNDWVNCEVEFGILLEKPGCVHFRGGGFSTGPVHAPAFKSSDSIIMKRTGIFTCSKTGSEECEIPANFYVECARLALLDVPGTIVLVAVTGECIRFELNGWLIAKIPIGASDMTGRPAPCGFVRFCSPRCEFVLSACPPSFSSAHDRKYSLLSLRDLKKDSAMMYGAGIAVRDSQIVKAFPMYLDNLLSYGRSAIREFECAVRLSRASEELAGSMFQPSMRQRIAHPILSGTPTGLFNPINFGPRDPEEGNAVVVYESVYPFNDKQCGYGLLLTDCVLLCSFFRDVALIGETCRRAGVVHNDMHGRNVLWRSQPCQGASLLSLIDMDRSEAIDDPDLAGGGIVKDVCTYIIESLCAAYRENAGCSTRPSAACLSLIEKVNVAMSACMRTGSVFWSHRFGNGPLLLATNFDILEKWNPSQAELPPKESSKWQAYYTHHKGQNFRVKPSYIRQCGVGARECSVLLEELLNISCLCHEIV